MFQNPTVNLNALCNSCAKIAWCSSQLIFTFLYAASNIHNASSNSSAVCTFLMLTPLFIQCHKKNLMELGLEIRTAISRWPKPDTRSYRYIFSQWPILSVRKRPYFLYQSLWNESDSGSKMCGEIFPISCKQNMFQYSSQWCLELDIKLIKHKTYSMYHQFQHSEILCSAHTVHFCVLCGSENK